jgi:quinoprotein glucose dehydrogenase
MKRCFVPRLPFVALLFAFVSASIDRAETPANHSGVGTSTEGSAHSIHPLINPSPGLRFAEPVMNKASDDGIKAIRRMSFPAGFEMKLWAAEPMLANPVAFNIDERGRIFVSETYRYRSSTLDIRDYRWMLEEDLATQSIDQRLSRLERNFGPGGVKELSIESEIVRLVEDTDGDGVADRSTVYADGFNEPLNGIAAGILARRGEVWFTNIPSIWKFSGERRAETRTELSRGYGVRFSITGHDLHGLTWGPDGKIYFSFGDRGANVKTKEGAVLQNLDSGAVYRMNPDGTELERVADGLRNPQSLLFMENGDLLTADNDSDLGDEERLVHVVEGGDSGWRIGYQHSPLSPAERIGPWSAEKMWAPRHEGQPAFLLPPICNIEDGPSGIAYYPGTGLNSSFLGSIFICHFNGAQAKSGIFNYSVKPKGASYEIADSKPFLTGALPTDVRFGPDGRLYFSDWVEGYPKSKRGRIYALSDPDHANDPIIKETQQLISGDWTKRSLDELAALLAHADWRVRLEAQFTLAERGGESIPALTRIATTLAPEAGNAGDPTNSRAYARRHAIWGLGQLATKYPNALAPLAALVRDPDPEVRAQSIKVLGDRRDVSQANPLLAALTDENSRVKFFAAQSLGKLAAASPALAQRTTRALLEALRANNDEDAYLRHAIVWALTGGNDIADLLAASSDSSPAVRKGVLLALRRLGRPEIARFLNDPDPFIVTEAAFAINDAPINAAMPSLAAMIAKGVPAAQLATEELHRVTENLSDAKKDGAAKKTPEEIARTAAVVERRNRQVEPVLYRAINANFRLGAPGNAVALARFATRTDIADKLRAEALTQLSLWAEPPDRDRIVGVYRPIAAQASTTQIANSTRDPAAARKALGSVIASLLEASTTDPVQTAALVAVDKLQVATAANALFQLVKDESQPASKRIIALTALDKLNDPRLPEAVKIASASTADLRFAALPIIARLSPAKAAPSLANIIAKGDVPEIRTALKILGTFDHPLADTLLLKLVRLLVDDKVVPALQLDLLEAAAQRKNPEIQKMLTDREAALAKNPDPLAAYRFALGGGDRERGLQVFETQPALACVRCHRVGTESGGDAGPNLADVGAKYPREYILESIIKPNAKIAPGFETIVLTRKSGEIAAGVVAAENDRAVSLRSPDGKIVEVDKSDVAKREGAASAMPEVYATLLSKSELRDLVAYVSSIGADAAHNHSPRSPTAHGVGESAAPSSRLSPPRALAGIIRDPSSRLRSPGSSGAQVSQ